MKIQRNERGRSGDASTVVSRSMMILLLFAFVVIGAGCSDNKELGIQEQKLIDARHNHLRCELYLDRLRDLYQVTPEEKDGLMDGSLDPGRGSPDTEVTYESGDAMAIGHDGPLTGGHDGPLTGGHDGPLTGGHDLIPSLLEGTLKASKLCWDAVDRLVVKYNECVEKFVTKEACGGEGLPACLDKYGICLNGKRPSTPEGG